MPTRSIYAILYSMTVGSATIRPNTSGTNMQYTWIINYSHTLGGTETKYERYFHTIAAAEDYLKEEFGDDILETTTKRKVKR